MIKNKITDIILHIMEIKREYIIYKNFRRKKEINEKFIIKCIEIFEKFFCKQNDNFNSFEILPKNKKVIIFIN